MVTIQVLATVERLKAETERLREALEKYGRHVGSGFSPERPQCKRVLLGTVHTQPSDCDCGLWAALKREGNGTSTTEA